MYPAFGYRRVLFFLTSLRSFSSSPLGNLQTAFALLSLAASVVNKENQKNFRAHPCGMLWPFLPNWLGWVFSAGRYNASITPMRPRRKTTVQRTRRR